MSLAPDFARSSLQLALELHEVIRESAGSRNVLFSPFLLSSALVGLYNGARGRTADQIARAAHLGYEEPRQVSTCLPIWHARLFPTWPDSNRRNFEMRHDNCLVYDKGLRLADGYKRWLSRWCRVEAEDFAHDPTDGVVFPTRMTAWIGALTSFSCKTPEDASFWTEVDRTTSLFLLSILFIKGKWRHVFHVTRGFFHETPKKSKVVRMMNQTGHFRTAESVELGASMLEIPYREHKKTMVILVPDPPNSLRDLEGKLSAHQILSCIDRLEDNGPVSVSVPMFRVSDVVDLKEALPALGVKDAFRPDADFSTLCDSAATPKVSFARHVAVFHARERASSRIPKYTGAQAAPGISTPTAADDDGEQQEEQEKFIVDRPFLFLVMNSEPKAVLLFGSVRKIFAWK
ncbi:iris-like [Dermacentor variabilis]|uniref:iris-like n=1 Tax=Dermacentor variabilis TaxID=34621 RepID=UPI003F5AFCE2